MMDNATATANTAEESGDRGDGTSESVDSNCNSNYNHANPKNKKLVVDTSTNAHNDLVWDDDEEDYNNNDDDLSYEEEEEEDDDDDDDLSFKSAITSYTHSSSAGSTSTNARRDNGLIYSSSLEESFIAYAHDSTISPTLPPRLRSSPSLVPPHLLIEKTKLEESSLGEVILEEEMGKRLELTTEGAAAAELTESFDQVSYSSSCSSSSSFVDAISEDGDDGDEIKQKFDHGNDDRAEINENEDNVDGDGCSTAGTTQNETKTGHINQNQKMSNSASTEIVTNNSTTTPTDNMFQQKQPSSKSIHKSYKAQSQVENVHVDTIQTPQSKSQTQYYGLRPKINSFTFNQDKDCIAIATSTGYRIRTLPLSMFLPQRSQPQSDRQKQQLNHVKIHQVVYPPPFSNNNNSNNSNKSLTSNTNSNNHSNSGIAHIQIIHSTSVLFIVKKQTPRLLSIVHAKTAQLILDIPFTNAIRRIEANIASLIVLTADGLLHVFSLKGGKGSSTGTDNEMQNTQQKKGIQFIKTIHILHSSESTRMVTAENAKTQGAFFDLSSHLFVGTSTAAATSNNGGSLQSKAKIPDGDSASSGGDSWLVAKSSEGVGYVSVYKTSTKVFYVTKEQKGRIVGGGRGNDISINSTVSATTTTRRKPLIQKKKKDCLELVETFQAHTHSIQRIAIGGASNVNLKQKVFATVSMKVSSRSRERRNVKNFHYLVIDVLFLFEKKM